MIGWDKRKVSVYAGRDILPRPSIVFSGHPAWTIKQIEEWMQDSNNKKYLD